jgi:hypothetical protein
MNMALTVYPVYCFSGYFAREYVFLAFTRHDAESFVLHETREDRPNGFYCAPSRIINRRKK